MKNRGLPSLIEIAILAYCAIMAADLPHSWVSTPSVRYAWIAFAIWIVPWIWYVANKIRANKEKGSTPILLGIAVAVSLVGTIGSLHVLNHFGLALALAGMLPFSWPQLVWLGSFISWIPALGWLTKLLAPLEQFVLQIAIAAFGSLWLLLKKDNS